jgi:tetratricopeptide (TPR) repeat protein
VKDGSELKPHLIQPKRHIRKKWWIIAAIVGALFIGGAVSGWVYLAHNTPEPSAKTDEEARQKLRATIDDADILASSGKTQEAMALYDQALSESNDPFEKSRLLLNKSRTSFNAEKYDEALTMAKEAESVQTSATVTYFIAQIYEKKNDTESAIAYYEKTIPLVDRSSPVADDDIQYYKSKIKILNESK